MPNPNIKTKLIFNINFILKQCMTINKVINSYPTILVNTQQLNFYLFVCCFETPTQKYSNCTLRFYLSDEKWPGCPRGQPTLLESQSVQWTQAEEAEQSASTTLDFIHTFCQRRAHCCLFDVRNRFIASSCAKHVPGDALGMCVRWNVLSTVLWVNRSCFGHGAVKIMTAQYHKPKLEWK